MADSRNGGSVKKYWRLLGSLVLVGLLIWRIDWRQVGSAFAQLNVTYWLMALGVYAVAQCVSAARWQILAGTLGLGGRWWDYLSYYFIGMFFNLVLPTSVGGDVVRAWYLDGKSGRRAIAFISVVADRVGGVVLLLLALIALPFRPAGLPAWVVWMVAGIAGGALLGLAVLFFLPRIAN